MMLIQRLMLLALVAGGLGSAACASEIDDSGTSADNGGMHTAEQRATETRVAVVLGQGVSTDSALPPRPPSIFGSYCVDLGSANAQITGEDLLARIADEFGVNVIETPDPLVCQIEAYGCPADNCFCDPEHYWSYWNRDVGGTAWTYAVQGHAERVLSPGDMDGWSWLSTSLEDWDDPKYALPETSFADICPPRTQVFLPVVIR